MTVYQTPVKIMVYVLMVLILLRVNVSQGLQEQIVKQVRMEIIQTVWVLVMKSICNYQRSSYNIATKFVVI